MSSAGNVYSAEPALPILGHSLLSQAVPEPGNQSLQTGTEPASPQVTGIPLDTWDLKHDIERGMRSSGSTVFHCGKVIGFSRLRKKGEDDDSRRITQLPLQLLTTHLHKTPEPGLSFIIHPANLEPFSPKSLLASLLSPIHKPSLSREEAIRKLDYVQLLPVFDFRSAVQAINEVSDILHKLRNEQDDRLPQLNHADTTAAGANYPVVFIIAGLDTLAEGVIRASNPGKGAAVLMATLRTLTQLSRMHASFLSVMLVNTSGLGTFSPGPATTSSGPVSGGGGQMENNTHENRDGSIHSIFRHSGTSLFPSVLLKTLDMGIDTHLLMSAVRNTHVVEVIKDREGDGVGKWCIWE